MRKNADVEECYAVGGPRGAGGAASQIEAVSVKEGSAAGAAATGAKSAGARTSTQVKADDATGAIASTATSATQTTAAMPRFRRSNDRMSPTLRRRCRQGKPGAWHAVLRARTA